MLLKPSLNISLVSYTTAGSCEEADFKEEDGIFIDTEVTEISNSAIWIIGEADGFDYTSTYKSDHNFTISGTTLTYWTEPDRNADPLGYRRIGNALEHGDKLLNKVIEVAKVWREKLLYV